MRFKLKSHPIWILKALDLSESKSLVTTLPCCSVKTWFQRHSPLLVPWYKCFSSLVSDFYWIALSLCPCGYGKSAPAPNYPILFQWQAPFIVAYCVWWQRAGYARPDWYFNQKLPNYANYAVKTQTLTIPLLLRFFCKRIVVGIHCWSISTKLFEDGKTNKNRRYGWEVERRRKKGRQCEV